MSLNYAGAAGGALSGAATGSVFGPIGTIGGALVGGISSLFGGGGTQFLPSELMQRYMDIGLADVKPKKWKKELDIEDAKMYLRSGDRGAYENQLRNLVELYPTETRYAKALRRSLKKDVDLANRGFDIADQLYENVGLTFTDQEYRDMADRAKRSGIRGPSAFGDFLTKNLMAQGKMLTPQQEQLSYIFGGRAFPRTSEGYYMTYGSTAK
jgi:hypothetical protein